MFLKKQWGFPFIILENNNILQSFSVDITNDPAFKEIPQMIETFKQNYKQLSFKKHTITKYSIIIYAKKISLNTPPILLENVSKLVEFSTIKTRLVSSAMKKALNLLEKEFEN